MTELRAVTVAAMRLSFTQPALSRRLEALERAPGLRPGTAVSLSTTPCGREREV